MILSLDSETTGVDLYHGALPFLVTFCDDKHTNEYWEWDVDPLTRIPEVVESDLDEIQEQIDAADLLILQNPSFDYRALRALYQRCGKEFRWDWKKVRDTLLAGHLLASNQPHDLTSMALIYLGINIKPLEDNLTKMVNEARAWTRKNRPTWKIADEGVEGMPSAKRNKTNKKDDQKSRLNKFDMWLLRAVAKEQGLPDHHPYWSTAAEYANGDSAVTGPIHEEQLKQITARKLTRIYEERLKILPLIPEMSDVGLSVSKERFEEKWKDFSEDKDRAQAICVNIAKGMGQDLILPKAGNNKSLITFVFGKEGLGLEPLPPKRGKGAPKTDQPTFDKTAIDHYIATIPKTHKAHVFVKNLKESRSKGTALQYMTGYQKHWLPLGVYNDSGEQLWMCLHPSLNPTGTDTLRWSSSNPNEQNISKKEEANVRYIFGPAPGREWWSCDAQNIELRLPAYEAGEESMIQLFERPNDPPYYGSNHLLIFDILHPEKFAQYGKDVKKVYNSTWYQWVKNGNFAVQYGAQEESGTADLAYHVPGAQSRIKEYLREIDKLSQRMIDHANKFGYVETIPDKTVDPARGYPLLCTRSQWGRVKPTVPLSYHVQGSAMWWMMKAMIRVREFLQEVNEGIHDPQKRFYLIGQIHDELLFDFPKGQTSQPHKHHLPKIRKIQKLMSLGGDDFGIPTPASAEYHPEHWMKGVSV